MGSKTPQAEQDAYAQLAGAIGGLAIVAGCLAALKDKLGLNWPATLAVAAGILVALGYGIYKVRGLFNRWKKGELRPLAVLTQEAPVQAVGGLDTAAEATSVPAHPELTEALITAGVIGKEEVIRVDEVTIEPVSTGKRYNFLLPRTRTYQDVEKRLANVAGWFGVSRLHVKLDRSRENERRVHLLMLDQAPFTQPFPAPTRRQIETFAGIPIGHDVTGELAGVPTFDKASMLIGGMTQMGKTTLVNGIITCLLIAYGEFDLYLLDGKICGLITFEKACVRYEASDQPAVFESMVSELYPIVEGRYQKKREAKRNRQPEPQFRPVIFIVDEVADFFADDGTAKGKEQAARIAEKARKLVAKSLESGVSVIMLTQRPDRDAIPVNVRNQFQYRMCMYVESAGTAKVTLGDSYFETAAPISPTHLNPHIKGQGVLFAGGTSTLLRGFDFEEQFMWEVVDEVADRQQKKFEAAPLSPLKQAIDLMRNKGVDFMYTQDLAPFLGIEEEDVAKAGKQLSALLKGVPNSRKPDGRGYSLDALTAAAKSDL